MQLWQDAQDTFDEVIENYSTLTSGLAADDVAAFDSQLANLKSRFGALAVPNSRYNITST